MPVAQLHGFRYFAAPRERLSVGRAAAVGRLGENAKGDVALENGPGGKHLFAYGTVRSGVGFAQRVPVGADALATEGVSAGDGDGDYKAFQAYGTGQVQILGVHL